MLSTFLFLLRIKKFDIEICEDLLFFFWSGPQFDFGGTATTVKHGEGKLRKKERNKRTKNISKLLLFPSYHKYPKILQTKECFGLLLDQWLKQLHDLSGWLRLVSLSANYFISWSFSLPPFIHVLLNLKAMHARNLLCSAHRALTSVLSCQRRDYSHFCALDEWGAAAGPL